MDARHVILAIDSFKGCLTSAEANQAAAEGLLSCLPGACVRKISISDGGEGWLDAFHSAMGGRFVDVDVLDPLMRPIVAQYLVQGDVGVIEMARASGLALLSPEERNPLVASTYGTGQLVVDALRRGCRHILVGLGGSSTSDCGQGMLRALADSQVEKPGDIRFTIATDVCNPLCGPNGAAHVFAAQKGATADMIHLLEARACRFADESARRLGHDRRDMPGAGAAGGLGYAFLQYLGADRRLGIDLLLDAVHFDELLGTAVLVVTGEGSADRQTLMGKVPYGILQRARAQHVPVALIAGRIRDRQALLDAGFSSVQSINPHDLSLEEAMRPETAKTNIRRTVRSFLSDKV